MQQGMKNGVRNDFLKLLLTSFIPGEVVLQIYNGADGELLWHFYKQMNESVLSNANVVMERMMRKVGRNFPYAKG